MSRWFRHYSGMMRDEKLVRVAVKSKQPVERVVWVWGAILESAAEINDAGKYEFDAGEAGYFLRCDSDEIELILSELENSGRIIAGIVARWGDRQFSSDAGAERQRRYRERRNAHGDGQELQVSRNGDGAVTSRDGAVTLQETDTEIDKKETPNGVSKKRATRLPADWVIPDEWLQEAITSGLSRQRALSEAERMKNWSLSNKNGAKLDWLASWRNWYRDKIETSATAPPKPRTVGDIFRDDAKRMGLIPNDKSPDTIDGHLETGNGSRESGGTGIARRFAVTADILGRLG